jgi:hypothetical protein
MFKICVGAFSVSVDGFGAGSDQGRDHPRWDTRTATPETAFPAVRRSGLA